MKRLRLIPSLGQFQVRVLTELSELARVEALAQTAYLDSGKTAAWKNATGAPNTSQLRVLGFYLGSRCTGSVSLHFPSMQTSATSSPFAFLPQLVQQQGIDRGLLPKPEDCIEISRLAIEKEFRGSGLLKLIFQSIHRELRLSGRSQLLISSDTRLLAKYRSVTFRPTGLTYSKQQQGHADQISVLSSRQKHLGAYAVAVDPIRWCIFVKGTIENLEREGLLKLSMLEKVLYPLYSLFNPIARVLERRWLKKNGYVRTHREGELKLTRAVS